MVGPITPYRQGMPLLGTSDRKMKKNAQSTNIARRSLQLYKIVSRCTTGDDL